MSRISTKEREFLIEPLSPFLYFLEASTMQTPKSHTFPRSTEDCPYTPDEEKYHRELWEEIPGLYNNRMTDEEFEIFVRLDGGVRVEALGSSENSYTRSEELDHAARYFNDEDLYQHSDDEYDYPRGVEDEYDAYMWDVPEEDMRVDARKDIWPDLEDHSVKDVRVVQEEEVLDTQYFDANDLYDRGDVVLVSPRRKERLQEEYRRRGASTSDEASQLEGALEPDTAVLDEEISNNFVINEKSLVERMHKRSGASYMRTQSTLRS